MNAIETCPFLPKNVIVDLNDWSWFSFDVSALNRLLCHQHMRLHGQFICYVTLKRASERSLYLSFSSVNTTEIPSWAFLVLQKIQSRRQNPSVSLSNHSEESACLAFSSTYGMMKLGHIITLIFWEVKCLTLIPFIPLKVYFSLKFEERFFFFLQNSFFLI